MYILLVEDNEDLRIATGELLEDAGHSVAAVAGAEEALALLGSSSSGGPAPVEALVTDVELPGMSGTELVRRLLASGSSLPLVVTSSLHRRDALEELESSGRVSFLQKPFSTAQLERALKEAVAARDRPATASGAPAEPSLRRSPRGLLTAAALVVLTLALGLGWQLASAPPELPAPPSASVLRGGRVLLEEPLGEILMPPRELRWLPVEGARAYRVILRSVDDTVLWQEESAAAAVALPPEQLRKLERAVVYYWEAQALGSEGQILARSEQGRFLLRPQPGAGLPGSGDEE